LDVDGNVSWFGAARWADQALRWMQMEGERVAVEA
jgi:hypothetical protein